MNTVLTVAGSDPCGGAGVPVDLKTFSAYGVYGYSAISAIVAQNTKGVNASTPIASDFLKAQIEAVFSDTRPLATKTGMLATEESIKTVSAIFKKNRVKNLVVDPVIKSSNGKVLLTSKGIEELKLSLLPLALLVTPNISEAEVLSGIKIKTNADKKRAAKKILGFGVKAVLIKGGHGTKNADDFLFDGKKVHNFPAPRLIKKNIHGTGCVLSAAITAGLAQNLDLISAVEKAKDFITQSIGRAIDPGSGDLVLEPLNGLYAEAEKHRLMQKALHFIQTLKENKIGGLIPEVQSNLGLAIGNAKGLNDVIGIPGRIIRNGDDAYTVSPPMFGGSRHVADIVLTVMTHDSTKRAVMNIKYSDQLLSICKKLKYKIASFDRADEPKKVKALEGSSLEWGTDKAIRDFGSVPDIIFDLGGFGKEEMIRVIANDCNDLLKRILKINLMAKKL
jgi:hydroxymethylpyrimidine kinase / phosphomethylpyrimidine kinase / thiamine-phosphate diphosphorylase